MRYQLYIQMILAAIEWKIDISVWKLHLFKLQWRGGIYIFSYNYLYVTVPFNLVDAGKACLTALSNSLIGVMQRVNSLTTAVADTITIQEETGNVIIDLPSNSELTELVFTLFHSITMAHNKSPLYHWPDACDALKPNLGSVWPLFPLILNRFQKTSKKQTDALMQMNFLN